jgi:hypothetical protein
MGWNVLYSPHSKVVTLKSVGFIPLKDFPDRLRQVVQTARENQTNCFLLDDTEFDTQASTLSIYELPKLYAEAGFSRQDQIAVVISSDDTGLDDYRFFETVCINQGFKVKLFFDLEEAYRWLRPKN